MQEFVQAWCKSLFRVPSIRRCEDLILLMNFGGDFENEDLKQVVRFTTDYL